VVVRKRVVIGLALLVGVSALTVGNGGAAPAHQGVAANRQAAVAEAGRLLTAVVLPAGSTAVAQDPAGDTYSLATPFIGAFFAAEVDRHAFWTTSASPAAAVALFQAHLPPGAKLVSSISGGGSAGAAYAIGTTRLFVVGPVQVMLNAVTLITGLTGIRADAQVRYVSPRLPSQRVPLSARLVQVTKADIGAKPLVSLVVTQRAIVWRLARLVNALPFVGTHAGVFSCPSFGGPIDTFIFRARPAGPPLATVSESAYTPTDPSPCASTTLVVRGHRLNSLLEGGILLKRASRLLGVRLTG
jgi:hypothetical protein